MKRRLSLLIAVIMILSLVTACGSPGEKETSGDPSDGVSSGPSRDDLNISINTSWTTSDPHMSTKVQDRAIFSQLYESLFFYDELAGEAKLQLAESYDVSDDGKVWTIVLKDAYFHNGDKVKASDVKFSFERCFTPGRAGNDLGNFVDEIKVVDDKTVEFIFPKPYAPFMLSSTLINVLSEREVNENGGEDLGNYLHHGGTGPYYLDEMNKDEKVVLKAFDKYYEGEPSIKTVNFFIITDSAAGMIALESGDLDWFGCSMEDLKRMEGNPKYDSDYGIANHWTYLAVNANGTGTNTAIKDIKVRAAIAHAIDKDEINMIAFDGKAQVADHFVDPDANIGAPRHDFIYDYNPEKSKKLLAEAGYPDGVDVGKLQSITTTYFETVTTVIQAQLEKVGIRAELEWGESATLLTKGKAGDYDLYTNGGNRTGEYDYLRAMWHHSGEQTNYTKYSKIPELNSQYYCDLMDEAAAELDPEKRLALHKEIDEWLMGTYTYIPLFNKAVPYVWDKNLNPHNRPTYYYLKEWSWN